MADAEAKYKLNHEELDKVSGGSITITEGEPTPTVRWNVVHDVPVGTVYPSEATCQCPVCKSTMCIQIGASAETYVCSNNSEFVLQVLPGGDTEHYCEVISCG